MKIPILLSGTLVVVMTVFGGIYGSTVSKCTVVQSLRSAGVPDSDLRDWLCLVKHESSFRYDARNTNSGGSKDYGIYQINNRYWCDRPDVVGYNANTADCWKFNTYGCDVTCSSLLNSIPYYDSRCAVKIKSCNSFNKWYGWVAHCKGQNLNSNSDYDPSGC